MSLVLFSPSVVPLFAVIGVGLAAFNPAPNLNSTDSSFTIQEATPTSTDVIITTSTQEATPTSTDVIITTSTKEATPTFTDDWDDKFTTQEAPPTSTDVIITTSTKDASVLLKAIPTDLLDDGITTQGELLDDNIEDLGDLFRHLIGDVSDWTTQEIENALHDIFLSDGTHKWDIIVKQLGIIGGETLALKASLEDWDGTAFSLLALHDQIEELVDSIENATDIIHTSPRLGIRSAFVIKGSTRELKRKTKETIAVIRNRAEEITALGRGIVDIVLLDIQKIRAASGAVTGAICPKLKVGKGVCRKLGKKMDKIFRKGVSALEPPKLPDFDLPPAPTYV